MGDIESKLESEEMRKDIRIKGLMQILCTICVRWNSKITLFQVILELFVSYLCAWLACVKYLQD